MSLTCWPTSGGNICAGSLQETWMKTRSTATPASKVPPKPSRMPYSSGRATSRGPFWYRGTGARSTIRSRSRQDKSLANTHTHTHTHTGQTGQTHLPSQRTAGALLSSFNLKETPGNMKRKKKKKKRKWTGDNYIFEFRGIVGNTPHAERVLMLRSNELEACPRPPNLIRHLI